MTPAPTKAVANTRAATVIFPQGGDDRLCFLLSPPPCETTSLPALVVVVSPICTPTDGFLSVNCVSPGLGGGGIAEPDIDVGRGLLLNPDTAECSLNAR